MACESGSKIRPIIWVPLVIGFIAFSTMFGILSISCQAQAPAQTPPPPPTLPPAPALPPESPQPAPGPTPTVIEMEISGFAFVPPAITVSVGTTGTWENMDSASHTVTTRDTLFDSGTLSRGATFSYTFEQRGTFEYYCTIHPYMTGTIIVE